MLSPARIQVNTLSEEEERKLLANASPHIQDIVVFDLNKGLRIGEIFSLGWGSVDLEKGLLYYLCPQNSQDQNSAD